MLTYGRIGALFRGKSFLRSSSILVTGTVAAQAVSFISSLILTRLYSSSEFGHFTAFSSLVAILAVFGALSYDKALILTKSNSEYRSIVVLICLILLALLILIMGSIAVLYCLDVDLPLGFSYFECAVWLPVSVFGATATLVFVYTALRKRAESTLATIKVAQNVATGALQVGAAHLMPASGLIAGLAIGQLVNLWALKRLLKLRDFKAAYFSRRIVVRTARKYNHYPKYFCPNELIDTVASQLPLLLIGSFISLSVLGQYAFCQRILSAPAAIVGQAIAQVFLQQISLGNHDNRGLKSLMFSVWRWMAIIGIIPFLIVGLFGPQVFSTLFGQPWIDAGYMAQFSAILLFVRFVSSSTSTIYLKLRLQKAQLYFTIAAFLYRNGVIFLALFGVSIYGIILCHVILEVAFIVLYNMYALYKLKSG